MTSKSIIILITLLIIFYNDVVKSDNSIEDGVLYRSRRQLLFPNSTLLQVFLLVLYFETKTDKQTQFDDNQISIITRQWKCVFWSVTIYSVKIYFSNWNTIALYVIWYYLCYLRFVKHSQFLKYANSII